MKSKVCALLIILTVYAAIQIIGVVRRSTEIVQWEVQPLGWSYSGVFFLIGVPLLVVWLTRRNWAEYGVSLANWKTNLDIGIKANLVQIIPYVIGLGGAAWLHLDSKQLGGGVVVAFTEIIAIDLMIWILNGQKTVTFGRSNLIFTFLRLVFPIVVALAMKKLSLIIVSTIIWQFIFSGFGEEFGHRGFMFPFLFPNKPLLGLLLGGFLWYLWHQPLLFVFPATAPVPFWQTIANQTAAIVGSKCTHTYLCYVYAKSRSIFVPSIAHIALNNASRSFAYFVVIQNQFTAKLAQYLVMVFVVAFLYYRKELKVIPEFLVERANR